MEISKGNDTIYKIERGYRNMARYTEEEIDEEEIRRKVEEDLAIEKKTKKKK